jgi:hypothetical protein
MRLIGACDVLDQLSVRLIGVCDALDQLEVRLINEESACVSI